MAIITKPTIVKGTPAIITLNKSELAAHPLVSSNSYFSDSSRWKKVEIIYISSPGNQSKIVEFDATLASPTGSILFSLKARNLFEVEKLNIVDFDNGILQIPRESLVVADFDIVMAPTNSIQWVNPAPDVYNIEADGGLTIGVNRGSDLYLDISAPSQVLNGDFELIFNIGNFPQWTAIGVKRVVEGDHFGLDAQANETGGVIQFDNLYTTLSAQGSLSNKQFKLKRIGSTTTFYIDGASVYTTTLLTSNNLIPFASLNAGGGSLISATIE